jgi:hypothetical protein
MTDEPTSKASYAAHKILPDFLDGSMTRTELVAALEDMRFPRRGGSKSVEIDAAVRDYLVGVLRR